MGYNLITHKTAWQQCLSRAKKKKKTLVPTLTCHSCELFLQFYPLAGSISLYFMFTILNGELSTKFLNVCLLLVAQ